MARSFNGSTQRIDVSDDASLRAQFGMSGFCWLYRDASAENDYLMWKRGVEVPPPNNNSGWGFYVTSSDQLVFVFFGVSQVSASLAGSLTGWKAVGFTVSSGGTVRLYEDGTEIGTGSPASTQVTSAELHIAVRTENFGVIDGYSDQTQEHTAVWQEELSAGEMLALGRGRALPLDLQHRRSRLSLYFDDRSTPPKDMSRHHHTITLVAAPPVVAGPPLIPWRRRHGTTITAPDVSQWLSRFPPRVYDPDPHFASRIARTTGYFAPPLPAIPRIYEELNVEIDDYTRHRVEIDDYTKLSVEITDYTASELD
jgi:hypothetical protein